MNRLLLKTVPFVGLFLMVMFLFNDCKTDNPELISEEDEDISQLEENPDIFFKVEENSDKFTDDISENPDTLDKEDKLSTEKLFVLGRCEYNGFSGKAEIINININTSEEIEIVLNFFPYNPEDINRYRFPGFPDKNYRKKIVISPDDLNIIIREASVIEIGDKEYKQGDIIECIRLEVIKGTCTPVVFLLPELE